VHTLFEENKYYLILHTEKTGTENISYFSIHTGCCFSFTKFSQYGLKGNFSFKRLKMRVIKVVYVMGLNTF